jgi:hypothetical protein
MKILKSIKDRFGFKTGPTGPVAPTYAVTPTSTSITEGDTVTFNVTTTNVPSGTTLYWTNAGTTDGTDFNIGVNSGSFTITNNTGNVALITFNNATYEGTETIIFQVRTGSTSGPIVATAATVNIADAAPTYSVSPTTTSITEGSSVTFNVTTTNVPNSTTLYWTNSGTTDGTDFSGGANSGSFTITSNAGSVSITTLNNAAYEGTETIIFNVRTGSTSGPIVATASTVNVADAAPTYSVSPTTTSITEGSSVTFNVTTTNVPNSTTLYWTNGGTTDGTDFSGGANNGSFTITSNAGSVSITTLNNAGVEGTETIIFQVRTGSTSGPIVATATTVNVADAAPTYSVSPSTTSVSEPNSVTWTITTTNIANGTTLYWTNSGTTNLSDFTAAVNSGSFTINSNTGSVSLTLGQLDTLEGTETIIFEVRTGSTSGPIVATSATVSVSDATNSFAISPSVSSVNEGGTVTWTVTAYNSPTTLYWTNGGTTTGADFTDGQNSGSFSISGTSGSISRTLTNDATTEGSETIIMQVRTGSTSGPIVVTSSTVTVNDTSVPTASVSPNVSSVNEGSSVTWTVSTSGYANGTYYWTNGGTTAAADFSIAANSGSFTLTSGSGSISLTLNNDLSSGEGSETIIMQIRTGSTSGPIIATSSTVTVNDTSFLPPPVTIQWWMAGAGGESHDSSLSSGAASAGSRSGTTTLNWQQTWSFQTGQIGPPQGLSGFKLCSHGCPTFNPSTIAGGGGGGTTPSGSSGAWGGPHCYGGGGQRITISAPFAIQVQPYAGGTSSCGGATGGAGMMVWCGTRTPQNTAGNAPNQTRGSAGGGASQSNFAWSGGGSAYQTIGNPAPPLGDRTHGGGGGVSPAGMGWARLSGPDEMGGGGGMGGIGGGVGGSGGGGGGTGGNGSYFTIPALGGIQFNVASEGSGVGSGAGSGVTPNPPPIKGPRNKGGVGYIEISKPVKVALTSGSHIADPSGRFYACNGAGGTLNYCIP